MAQHNPSISVCLVFQDLLQYNNYHNKYLLVDHTPTFTKSTYVQESGMPFKNRCKKSLRSLAYALGSNNKLRIIGTS